ncbi:Trypsin-like cysteine/serine peptidase domain [Plasmopara halstedii]|uniref:Trypsin-like cysteine/serine peptidase domain n=1 Tax=Plasmopara halstedii TaxID=4781 RepID=A0A0P1AMB6_PLAHL|nr:Trypsin-like cysteine/serine peptidase domain [Plasmopara halstedii]CEG42144.1 Trypsin-like cysteine/serine peptidase domain [Plasmopara halstedii]|eukprot:XP_024578513.1 Trypsin-like cysteine/serine peptidase domain [Plasmopara halstedii]
MLDGISRSHLAQLPLPIEASQPISPDTKKTTFGWGSTDPTKYDAIAEELHSVDLPVWDTEACQKALGFDFIDDRFICAGGEAKMVCTTLLLVLPKIHALYLFFLDFLIMLVKEALEYLGWHECNRKRSV